MPNDLEAHITEGVVEGDLIQFAEGRWPGKIGTGLAVSDRGFDLIEPSLRAAYPAWNDAHRYGVFNLTAPARRTLSAMLRTDAARRATSGSSQAKEVKLLGEVARWLDLRDADAEINILGY